MCKFNQEPVESKDSQEKVQPNSEKKFWEEFAPVDIYVKNKKNLTLFRDQPHNMDQQRETKESVGKEELYSNNFYNESSSPSQRRPSKSRFGPFFQMKYRQQHTSEVRQLGVVPRKLSAISLPEKKHYIPPMRRNSPRSVLRSESLIMKQQLHLEKLRRARKQFLSKSVLTEQKRQKLLRCGILHSHEGGCTQSCNFAILGTDVKNIPPGFLKLQLDSGTERCQHEFPQRTPGECTCSCASCNAFKENSSELPQTNRGKFQPSNNFTPSNLPPQNFPTNHTSGGTPRKDDISAVSRRQKPCKFGSRCGIRNCRYGHSPVTHMKSFSEPQKTRSLTSSSNLCKNAPVFHPRPLARSSLNLHNTPVFHPTVQNYSMERSSQSPVIRKGPTPIFYPGLSYVTPMRTNSKLRTDAPVWVPDPQNLYMWNQSLQLRSDVHNFDPRRYCILVK